MLRISIIIPILFALGMLAPQAFQALPEIQCAGFSAYEYAGQLQSPDGLAVRAGENAVYVAEEGAGRVTRLGADGSRTMVLSNLNQPEGIVFAADGTLYAVEDVAGGRVMARLPNGTITPWASGLSYPEGVAVSGNKLFVTESNIEAVESAPFELKSWVVEISAQNMVTRSQSQPLRSYSGITVASDGTLYIANEVAGFKYGPISVTDSIFRGTRENQNVFASGMFAPEGLQFANSGFPLYVAEEQNNEQGRISAVASDGSVSTVCTGFRSVEDIVADQQGHVFVSEDGRDRVVMLVPVGASPEQTATATPQLMRRPTWLPLVQTEKGG